MSIVLLQIIEDEMLCPVMPYICYSIKSNINKDNLCILSILSTGIGAIIPITLTNTNIHIKHIFKTCLIMSFISIILTFCAFVTKYWPLLILSRFIRGAGAIGIPSILEYNFINIECSKSVQNVDIIDRWGELVTSFIVFSISSIFTSKSILIFIFIALIASFLNLNTNTPTLQEKNNLTTKIVDKKEYFLIFVIWIIYDILRNISWEIIPSLMIKTKYSILELCFVDIAAALGYTFVFVNNINLHKKYVLPLLFICNTIILQIIINKTNTLIIFFIVLIKSITEAICFKKIADSSIKLINYKQLLPSLMMVHGIAFIVSSMLISNTNYVFLICGLYILLSNIKDYFY